MFLALLLLSGCGLLENPFGDLFDTVEGLTNPLVAEGLVLGVEPPEDEALAELLADSELELGTAVTVFLADARDASEVDRSGIGGAQVHVVGSQTAVASEEEAGVYTVLPAEGLAYEAGAEWAVEIDVGGDEPSELRITLPPPVDLDLPQDHESGTPLDLDLSGTGYDSALVVVVGMDGRLTWSNQPTTAGETVEWILGEEPLGSIQIPGEAFPEPSAYAVGVAGMRHAVGDEAVDNVNTAMSAMLAGQMRLVPVLTTSPIVAVGQVVAIEPPGDPTLRAALSASEFQAGTTSTVFVADALRGVEDLDDAAVVGASVTVHGNVSVVATDLGDGTYEVGSEGGLDYGVGETWQIEVDDTGWSGPGVISAVLPEPAPVWVPTQHAPNTYIDLDFTGMGYDSALVFVLDPTGEITWSNEPAGAEEFLDITGSAEPLGVATVPWHAFPDQAIYAVGVAAMVHSHDAVDLEPTTSALCVGRAELYAVSTLPY